ncbi:MULTISPECIES: hypothetical protein [unclassified Ruegeria]|uniref:hypothetical protein n=1 Tax=unclassified Ruegeria TaxID=2625375 RepID=UPI001491CB77|nr:MULTISPECIES: hypothetical protein [unclassified Ruegeria]NOD35696.1 hypothetical protein [Ruegeria sp. HKCCD7296]NOE43063.1 hypothetical protein [Ruegeria sp. HKCCD7319]
MPRKQHKTRKDSLTGLRQAAQADEPASIEPPAVPGVEVLNDVGKQFYAQVYQSNADGWSIGDLAMIVEMAFVQQQLHDNRIVCSMLPPIFTHPNGITGKHPVHTHQAELTKQLQTLARDIGLRSKDGLVTSASATKAPSTAEPEPGGENVTSFEAFLNDAINGG